MNKELLNTCTSLSDIARSIYGKANYTNSEKVKRDLKSIGVDWKEWLESKKKKPIYLSFRYTILMEMLLTIKKKISRFCVQIIMQWLNILDQGIKIVLDDIDTLKINSL